MFERFTDSARRVVVDAQEQARRLRHDTVGTEHLLLAMAGGAGSVAGRVLSDHALDAASVERELVASRPRGDVTPEGSIRLAGQTREALEAAFRESLALEHGHIGAEHLLLGILRVSGSTGARILTERGMDADTVSTRLFDPTPEAPGH